MNRIIVQTSQNVTLLGAGQASKAQLDTALAIAPYLIAADGGAELAQNYGRAPKKVIGDFDSIDKDILAQIPENRRFKISEQDNTDFEKCLMTVSAPLILGVGFLGRRLDHQLAALNALVRYRASPCILIGAHDIVFHLNRPLRLDLKTGSRLSLFPLRAVRGTSTGLQWPADGVDFQPGGQIGTSNRVLGAPVSLNFAEPGMLVILPRAALDAAVAALSGH